MENRVMLKSLTKEQIDKLSDIQLYNIMFGPVIDMKKKIEEKGLEENSVVAVYGATIVPIKRRMNALMDLIDVKKPQTIIFSGGDSWDGTHHNNKLRTGDAEKDKENIRRHLKNFKERTEDMILYFPFIKDRALKDMKKASPNPENFESSLRAYIEQEVEKTIDKMLEDPKEEKKYMEEYARINESLEQTGKPKFKSFAEWLYSFKESRQVRTYILHYYTEADLMEMIWEEVYGGKERTQKILLEKKSNDTSENAVECVKLFEKEREKNPKLNTITLVNEWPYLLRAVLTTQKKAQEAGVDIEIDGYPADFCEGVGVQYMDIEEYRKILRTNLKKSIEYQDVGDMDITEYFNLTDLIDNGEVAKIKNIPIRFFVQRQAPEKDEDEGRS